MKGLTARMAASYVALAVIVLAGAGALSYLGLARHLQEADGLVRLARLDAAQRMTAVLAGSAPDQDPARIAAAVERAYPSVRIVQEPPPALSMPEVALIVRGLRATDMALVPGAPVPVPPPPAPPEAPAAPPGPSAAPLQVPGAPLQFPEFSVRLLNPVPVPSAPLADRLMVLVGGQEAGAQVSTLVVDSQGRPRAVLRAVPAADPADARNTALLRALLGAGALTLAAAVAMAIWFSRTLSAPLARMAHAAGRLADGEWDTPLPAGGPQEIRTLSEAFRAMAGRLRTDFGQLRGDREQLQRLAAEVAHEIKTPIASLRTYHELLLDGEQEDPASRGELLRRGAAQVARLEYLAHFLVDMARLQAHTAPLDLEEADLADLVRQAAAALAPAAEQQGVQVATALPDGPVPVLANRHRLGQALDNLLQNALRWSPAPGAITVAVAVGRGTAVVTVADQGPGIPPDLLPRVFDPFVRGAGSQGLGLGLAIVRAIARSHGGDVTAANGPDGGARFTITLPAAPGEGGAG